MNGWALERSRSKVSQPRSYEEAAALLTGRCKDRRKLENNTYLQWVGDRIESDKYKWDPKAGAAVKLHGTDVVTFWRDGSTELRTGGWKTPITKGRIHSYCPEGWSVGGAGMGADLWALSHGTYSQTPEGKWEWKGERWEFLNGITIHADGTVTGGGDYDKAIREAKDRRKEELRPINRARRWIAMARGRKEVGPNTRKKLTVASIMAEENMTVRLAKMAIYGLDKFLIDADSLVIDARDGYELIELDPDPDSNRWNKVVIRALKMTCTSTGEVYVQSVPPNCDKVAEALDWIFDTKDYLGRVGEQA